MHVVVASSHYSDCDSFMPVLTTTLSYIWYLLVIRTVRLRESADMRDGPGAHTR